MICLFNGETGSLGRYVAPALAAQGHRAVSLRSRLEDRAALRHELGGVDIKAGDSVALLQLAAMVSVPRCEQDPQAAWQTNVEDAVQTVLAFVKWVRASGAEPTVVYVSSGHVYAGSRHGERVGETAPLAPRSVYAKTKLACEQKLAEHSNAAGFSLITARVFGLIAPRQPENYLLPGLIRRAREDRLKDVPGLDFFRDYLDARDVCACLGELAGLDAGSFDAPLTVNVCSGQPLQLRRIAMLILDELYPSDSARRIASLGAAPGRPDDASWIVGDPGRIENLLGKNPQTIAIDQTVRDALELKS